MKVPVKVFQEDEMFISYCPVFDISSQGYNEENAKANLILISKMLQFPSNSPSGCLY
jgi:hypothetical protein